MQLKKLSTISNAIKIWWRIHSLVQTGAITEDDAKQFKHPLSIAMFELGRRRNKERETADLFKSLALANLETLTLRLTAKSIAERDPQAGELLLTAMDRCEEFFADAMKRYVKAGVEVPNISAIVDSLLIDLGAPIAAQ